MTAMTKLGWGALLTMGVLIVLVHPGLDPIPTTTAQGLPSPELLVLAAVCLLALWRYTYPQAQWFSRCYGDHQELPYAGPDLTDLTCTRLC